MSKANTTGIDGLLCEINPLPWNRYLDLATSVVQNTASVPLRNKLIAWLPTVACLSMIAFFSTDTFSAKHTATILERIIRAVYGEINPDLFKFIHVFVRKAAHFTVYGTLSLSAYFSWRATLPRRSRWSFIWAGLALLLTLAAASLDEFHQSFVPSRGPSPFDVMLDMMGAMFVQTLIATFTRFRPQARQRKS